MPLGRTALFRRNVEWSSSGTSGRPTGPAGQRHQVSEGVEPVITLGVILLVIGFIVGIPVLWTIGIVLAVVGLILAVVGGTGRKVGGRAHWF